MPRPFTLLLLAAALAFMILPANAADEKAELMYRNLIAATFANDYDKFIAECDDTMRAAITKEVLTSVSARFATRARADHESQHLGELRQQGHAVHLFRLRFADGKDDVLGTLSIKDGKCSGFYLK